MTREAEVSEIVRSISSLPEHGAALRVHGVVWTWGELDRLMRLHAARLARLGVRAGDRVVVCAESSVAQVAVALAHLRLGVVHVPANTRYGADELAHVVGDSGASLVLREDDLRALALRHEGDPRALEGEPDPIMAWPEPPLSGALAMLIYTSGTTGRPKGVMLSHRALGANLGAMMRLWEIGPRDRVIAALPLFHVHGLGLALLGPLIAGAEVELVPRFTVDAVVSALAQGATVFMGVPTMYHLLLERLEADASARPVLAGARLFTAGSAALSQRDFERFERATGHRILERYGMTETLFTLSNPYRGERRAGSVGQPVPGVSLRLVDEHGAEVGAGPGEIEVRSEGLMDGYWGRPDATREAFRGPSGEVGPTSGDLREGWFRTGDTAVIEAGAWRLLGRTSTDIIKSGGYKIGAGEIEDVLMASGRFVECAVLGVPDAKWGEVVGAVVVPRVGAGDPLEGDPELIAHLERHLVDYKRPRRWARVEALPRNAMGKVKKAELRGCFEGVGGRGPGRS